MALATSFRYAEVGRDKGRPDPDEVRKYLPANYFVLEAGPTRVIIAGRDDSGWTLDDYVVPRLGSGWITAREIGAPPPDLVIPPVPDRAALIKALQADDQGWVRHPEYADRLADSVLFSWGRP